MKRNKLVLGSKNIFVFIVFILSSINLSAEKITHNGFTYETVTSPYTGRVWLDRNLGASRVCTAYNDSACYGDYYQWGRGTDGHEKLNSNTVSTQITDLDFTGSAFFIDVDRNYILEDYDWLDNSIDENGQIRLNNWLTIDGNSACPIGYKVATQNDLSNEIIGVNSIQKAFENFLKIPASGARQPIGGTGFYFSRGAVAYLWTSTLADPNYAITRSMHMGIPYDYSLWKPNARSFGFPVRCVKDNSSPTADAGLNQTVAVNATVTLDGSSSIDSDGSIVSYEWREYSTLLSTDATFSKSDFSEGIHYITLTVTDDKGATSTDTVTVVVNNNETWEVNVKDSYEVGQGKFFAKEFDVRINNIFPEYTEQERENVTIEDIQREYKPEDLNLTLNTDTLALNCEPIIEGAVVGLDCKISGILAAVQTLSLLVEDTKHAFSKSINIDFTLSEYKIEKVVTDDAFIILNGDDITNHLSFGFDAVAAEGIPVCHFKDKDGNESPMFFKKVSEDGTRYICSTSDYGWDGQYYGSVDIYKLIASAKEGNIEVNISFGGITHTINVPVYDRNELNANAVLEYAYDYDYLTQANLSVPTFAVVNSKVYSMDSLPKQIFLGGTSEQGTNNKDFVYLQGGIWRLSFQGHEMLININKNVRKSTLAFTVDNSDLSENSNIVSFISDPESNYNMLLKKTTKLRRFFTGVGEIASSGLHLQPEIDFDECESKYDLQNIEPTEYRTHPCFGIEDPIGGFHQTFADTTAGVRGTTLQINKDDNKSAIFNLLEGEVELSSSNLENNITLTDMTSFDVNKSTKSSAKVDTLSHIQKRYLADTSLNAVDDNKSIGSVTVHTNINDAKYYLLGDNVQTGYGRDTVFEEVAEGNYTLQFLPVSQYHTPNDINISITKDTLYQVFVGEYDHKPNLIPILMYLLN